MEAEVRNILFSPCSEFPNDNQDLHGGAVWVCLQVTGAPTWEPPLPGQPDQVSSSAAATTALAEDEVHADLGEEPVTEPLSLASQGAEVPDAAPTEGDLSREPVVAVPAPEAIVLAGPEGDDEGPENYEIVDEIVLGEVVEESEDAAEQAAADDPFAALVGILDGVARGAGATDEALSVLRVLTGRERRTDDGAPERDRLREQAAAWQAILRGESEDFGTVGASTLDEWSALVVAHALGQPQKTDMLRRELRQRGIAAFGVVVEYAA